MKHLFFTICFFILATTQAQTTQNDSIYFWKSGALLEKRSIKPADLDSITFKRPVVNPNGINIAGPSVTDIDGNTYQSVTNCGITFTKQNLNVTTYSDGTPIPQATDQSSWQSATTGFWCYVNYDPNNNLAYGKLYNWYAVAGIYDAASLADPNLRKNIAPVGWHVPSDAECLTLINCLGGYTLAGGAMKETGTINWLSPNTGATNSSGFTGLPGGYVYNGILLEIGTKGEWWTSNDISPTYARTFGLSSNNIIASRTVQQLSNGYSVRCVKN